MPPRPLDLYASFASQDVKYLVTEGVAAILHGVNRMTVDVDVLIEATPENAEAALKALGEIGLGTALLTTPEELLSQQVTIFEDVLPVDIHTWTPGIDFDQAWSRRRVEVLHGVTVSLLSAEDLIASKEAAGRPQDLEDAAILRRIQRGEA